MEDQTAVDTAGLKGCFRLRIREGSDGRVVGDSGWTTNLVTNDGIDKFFARCFAGSSGSLQVSHISIGTGGAPTSAATSLSGEQVVSSRRGSVSLAFSQRAASNGTATMQFAATLASSDSFITAAANISNIGLFNSSTSGTLMAGNTYTSSALATNQNVEVSYQIRIN
jgi:hypothetical protein